MPRKKKPTKPTHVSDAVGDITVPQPPDALARKVRGRPKVVAEHDDPVEELRRLVKMHAYHTRLAVGLGHQSRDRKTRETGEVIPCPLTKERRDDLNAAAKRLMTDATLLESAMTAQLRRVPIYQHFLSHVYGIGPVLAAYLVARIRIERAVTASQLMRYCGAACDPRTGRLERRDGGPRFAADGSFNEEAPGTFSTEMRSRLYLFNVQARKNASKATACETHAAQRPPKGAKPDVKRAFRAACAACSTCRATERPFGTTSKYLERWATAEHSSKTMDGLRAVNPVLPERLSAFAMRKGRLKATDLFLWDLYVVWRTLSGLPIYAEKFALERGERHDGSKPWEGPRMLTLDQALAMVGDAGGRPATAPLWPDAPEAQDGDDLGEEIEAAAQ